MAASEIEVAAPLQLGVNGNDRTGSYDSPAVVEVDWSPVDCSKDHGEMWGAPGDSGSHLYANCKKLPTLKDRLKGGYNGCLKGPEAGSHGLGILGVGFVTGTDFNGHETRKCCTFKPKSQKATRPLYYCFRVLGCIIGPCWCGWLGYRNPPTSNDQTWWAKQKVSTGHA